MNWIRRYLKVSLSKRSAVLLFFSAFVALASSISLLSNLSKTADYIFVKTPSEDAHTEYRVEYASAQNPSRPSFSKSTYPASYGGTNVDKFIYGGLSRLDGWTAIYDISAHTVYLPNGATLEAHSGRGSKLDNPRYVHKRMQGATPPHVYELALREKPFHGVRALRLKPIGGDEFIFGRTGLLAHTYMLGPNGDSNGCVVFKNYNAFLQAFESGEVKHLAVVAHID
jgi:hypothetical protein